MRENAASDSTTRKAQRERLIMLRGRESKAEFLRVCMRDFPPNLPLVPASELAAIGLGHRERLGIGRTCLLFPSDTPPSFSRLMGRPSGGSVRW